MEKFRLEKIHKLEDYFEQEVTQMMDLAVCEHFNVKNVALLSRDQIEDVNDYCAEIEEQDRCYGLLAFGLKQVIYAWEAENEVF